MKIQTNRSAIIETTDEEARALIARAMEAQPNLTIFGFGVFNPSQYIRKPNGAQEREARFVVDRSDLVADIVGAAAAADWIKRQELTESFNRKHDSYNYKHCVERWFRDRGANPYVANGSFIAAAIGLGLAISVPVGSPNARLRFKETTIRSPLPHVAGWVSK